MNEALLCKTLGALARAKASVVQGACATIVSTRMNAHVRTCVRSHTIA